EPYLRPMVWGGRKLGTRFGKTLPGDESFGESWEISSHRGHVSRVAEGSFQGADLNALCAEYGKEIFGESVPADRRFPLLIKLLDCEQLLSIQVHPTDELAHAILGDELGKTESWIVLDVGPQGRIYAGLREGITRMDLEQHLRAGTTDQCLHVIHPKVGDCIHLPAGTVHAVGGGVVIAEVQQTSDATFRLFDWNRMGTDGKPRTLHVDESLRCINFHAGPVSPVTPILLNEPDDGFLREGLVACPYFRMDRLTLDSDVPVPAPGRLSVGMVIEGSVELVGGDFHRELIAGETVLIPASAGVLHWRRSKTTQTPKIIEVTLSY
ncbi:MAG: type I phosphomannose isomerase catalytic subunit, partial [Planctomycetota bacterium]